MKKTLILISILLLLVIVAMGWTEHKLNQFRGHHTPIVDRSAYKVNTGKLLIRNVNVLSPDGARMQANMDVEIKDGLIASITSSSPKSIPTGDFEIVDGAEKYLIPALMDSHTHISRRSNDLLLYFANGVTHIREMGGTHHNLTMRQDTREGQVGPEMYIASEKIYGDKGFKALFNEWTRTRINISSTAEVNGIVENLAAQGFDAVKIGGFTSDDVHKALVAAGKEYEIDIIGHLHQSTGLEELWKGGQKELAHVEELVKAINSEFGNYNSEEREAFLKFVQNRMEDIALRLKEKQIAVTSTVWLMESLPKQKFDLAGALKTVELDYADPGHVDGTILTKGWLPGNNSYQLPANIENDPERRAYYKTWWETYVDAIHIATRVLDRVGVTLMAGTDTGTPIVVPGFSLHDELESLQAIGMSPQAALAAATSTPAKWLNLNRGRVAVGFDADLILLSKNPLSDISHTRQISAVIHGGNYYGREVLDLMLKNVFDAVVEARNE